MNKFEEKYSLPVGQADLDRMTMLGEIYMPYCADFLFENGLCAGLKVADVGCGPGNVSLWLSEQVGKTGQVFAIDNSMEQLNILNKKISDNKITNIKTCHVDIDEVNKIQERFDLIFCRFLLIHLSQPLIAIQKLRGLLNPGGCLVMAELDNSTWFSYPEHEALRQDTELLCAVGKKKGADFCIGPKLYGYLRQEHFNRIHVKIVQPVLWGAHRAYLKMKADAWAKTYLEYNLASESDLQHMTKNLHDLMGNEGILCAGAKMYLTYGRK